MTKNVCPTFLIMCLMLKVKLGAGESMCECQGRLNLGCVYTHVWGGRGRGLLWRPDLESSFIDHDRLAGRKVCTHDIYGCNHYHYQASWKRFRELRPWPPPSLSRSLFFCSRGEQEEGPFLAGTQWTKKRCAHTPVQLAPAMPESCRRKGDQFVVVIPTNGDSLTWLGPAGHRR